MDDGVEYSFFHLSASLMAVLAWPRLVSCAATSSSSRNKIMCGRGKLCNLMAAGWGRDLESRAEQVEEEGEREAEGG